MGRVRESALVLEERAALSRAIFDWRENNPPPKLYIGDHYHEGRSNSLARYLTELGYRKVSD